jgi:hypothetical protein
VLCAVHGRDVHRLYELLIRDDRESKGGKLSDEVETLRKRSVEVANCLDAVSGKLQSSDKAVVDVITAALPAGSPAPRINVLNKQVLAVYVGVDRTRL